jgi:hypothetical protein
MIGLVFLVEQIANGLYILIGVGVLLAWRSWMRARREYRSTHFELERQLARYQRANAATTLAVLLELFLIVFGIQRVVAPTIRATASNIPLPGQNIEPPFITPTPSFNTNAQIDISGVQIGEDDPAQSVLATPTLTPTPVGTIIPNVPTPADCNTEKAFLQVPANGMVVFEPINVMGAATTDNFAFYRFELKGPQTFGNFAQIGDYTQPVASIGELGALLPSVYEPGEYQFRLTVFDITQTLRASCTVTIFISEPIPTPTPLGQ